MIEKRPWLCAGNLPEPLSTLEDLKAFLAWAEPLADELENMEDFVVMARDRIKYLEVLALEEPSKPFPPTDQPTLSKE